MCVSVGVTVFLFYENNLNVVFVFVRYWNIFVQAFWLFGAAVVAVKQCAIALIRFFRI